MNRVNKLESSQSASEDRAETITRALNRDKSEVSAPGENRAKISCGYSTVRGEKGGYAVQVTSDRPLPQAVLAQLEAFAEGFCAARRANAGRKEAVAA